MTRMKIGEFLTGLAGETSVEIIHDPKNDYIELVSEKGRTIIKREAAYRLLGGLYFYLGLEPPVLPVLLTTAATWLRRFLDRHPQLAMVTEGGMLLVDRLEAHARVAKQGPAEQAAWVGRLLDKTKGKEDLIGASIPRCDWFGYDGEQAQCAAQGTQEIDGRPVCPEHYEIVKTQDAWKRTYIY